jgi:putative tributyrin esterase
MAFCELKYFSKSLDKAIAADILLPERETQGPFTTLYLLHGLSDDHTIWQRRTSIERYVADLPLIVVMPDSGRGFYCDALQGMAWESAIIKDLIGYVDTMFHTRKERQGRLLAGLSMGGYGAIKFALKYSEMFCGAVSHSGAMAFAHRPLTPDAYPERNKFIAEFARVVGENPVDGPNDLYALAHSIAPGLRPALRIDCGTDDFLIEDNRAFHAYLEEMGYAHTYLEFPGAHTWEYWDEHIQEALKFLMPHAGILPGAA